MQFHFNGFQPGDPTVQEADPRHQPGGAMPAGVDVLIVGAGPAGLTLAAQLSAFPDITTRIVEQKDGPIELGQADGIACRSMEMFEAFGFASSIKDESYWVNEVCFWRPTDDGGIHRSDRIQDVEDGLSEMPHVILNQARVHDRYLDVMARSATRMVPDYGRKLVSLTQGSPNTAVFEKADGTRETVRATYVVGCDGARSTVRSEIGRKLVGDAANQAWGVMDVLCTTNFPDIRYKCAIYSASEGNILIIPREGGHLVRMYVEMDKLAEDERVASRNITIDKLIAAAKRIFAPYELDVKDVAWWSVYEIGQRLCDKFDNVPAGSDAQPTVFIGGDACHTHSPKAGQGMNISMRDGFNLGWKLAAVLRGQADPALLDTYSSERVGEAQQLIDFDRELAKMFSAKPKSEDNPDGVDPGEFQRYFQQHARFTAGTETHYSPSIIVGDGAHQGLATGFPVGRRFHSAPVIRLSDGKRLELGHELRADGRWRLIAFADAEGNRMQALCDWLAGNAAPGALYTPAGSDPDAVIDVRGVYQGSHHDLDMSRVPAVLKPAKGRFGLTDYEKAFCPDLKDGPDIFDLRGIDRARGALLIVRPDQHVADVLPLDATDALAAFFAGFMRPV